MKWLTAERGRNILLALVLIVGAANIWSNHSQADTIRAVGVQGQEAQQAAQHRAQQAQAAQAAMIEHRLCLTLGKLAALTPPPGNAAANPSRAYEQLLQRTLSQLGPDLGCSG